MASDYEVVTYELEIENGLSVCIICVESEKVMNRKGFVCMHYDCAYYLNTFN